MDQTDTGEIVEKPSLTEEQAIHLIERLYGFKVERLRPLYSYDDLNFHVIVDGDTSRPHGYTLKVTNGTDSMNEGDCSENIVRLLTYLPGTVYHDVPMTFPLAYEAGVFLGKVQEALKDFSHPSLHRPDYAWNLTGLTSLDKYLHCLHDDRIKDKIRKIVQTFGDKVLSRIDEFPQGVVHGDFTDMNVLVEEESTHPGKYRICGLLDFGDVVLNPHVFDLAIALMHVMSVVTDPIEFGGHFLAGFESVRALTSAEWDVLYYCVVARASQSYVLGHYTASIHPQNTEYLMVTAGSVWKFIDMWWGTPKEEIYKQWRDIKALIQNQLA